MRIDFWQARKPNALAEAELIFEEGPLSGLKLVGVTVWKDKNGQLFATVPARAFGAGRERRYFDYLRPLDHSQTHRLNELKAQVVAAYEAALRSGAVHKEVLS